MDFIKQTISSWGQWNYLRKKIISMKCKHRAIMRENTSDGTTAVAGVVTTSRTELMQSAEEEIQEKPEWRTRDIQALRELVLADPELTAPTDDDFLLRFLRARKFDYDRAFQLIKQYYHIRLEYPELYSNFRPSAALNAFEQNLQIILPDCDQKGRKIFIYCAGKWNPDKCSLDDIFLANQFCLEKAILDEETQIHGIIAIADLKDFGILHMKHFRPGYIKKMVSLIQDCMPARFKAFHIINEPAVFEMLFAVIKPFLRDKTKERIFFHGTNLESLHQHVIPSVLPEEFGGEKSAMDNSSFVKGLMACDEEFFESTNYGYKNIVTDNSIVTINPADGIVGSYYRKICFD